MIIKEWLRVGVSLLMACFLYGCWSEDLPERHIGRKPDIHELIGIWTVNEGTKETKSKHPDQKINVPFENIILSPDSIALIPLNENSIFKFDQPEIPDNTDTLKGSWTLIMKPDYIGSSDSNYVVEIKIGYYKQDSYGKKMYAYNLYRLNLVEEEGELILWQYIGDPDQTFYQEYTKVAEHD